MFRAVYDKQYGGTETSKLFSLAKGNLSFVQRLKLYRKLEVHSGCVNTICWSDDGSSILSGADDQQLVITCPFTGEKQLSIRSGHRANIFSAKFLPNSVDKQIVSCSGDGKIYFTEVEREDSHGSMCFDCHYGTAYEVMTIPGETSTFLSCGEDGTVRWFDLRIKTKCQKEDCKEDVMINCRRAVTSLSVNPVLPYQLGVACSDSAVRIFDRRMLGTRLMGNYSGRSITGLISRFTASPAENRSYRITSLQYSPDGEDVLVSYSSEHLYLFSTKEEGKSKVYQKDSELPDDRKPTEDRCTKEVDKGNNSAKPEQPEEVSPCTNVEVDMTPTPTSQTEAPAEGADTSAEPDEPAAAATTSSATSSSATGEAAWGSTLSTDPNSRQPPIKRLRLRGDWSDTGPNARPESERQDVEERSPHVTLMQRMSDMLTRWLDSNIRPEQGETTEGSNDRSASDDTANPDSGETSAQGAVGGAGGEAESEGVLPKTGTQENKGLIQDLESMEIPSQPHCDITDTLRSLSKYHQASGPAQHPRKRSLSNTDSFKLSTSPSPVDTAEAAAGDPSLSVFPPSQSTHTVCDTSLNPAAAQLSSTSSGVSESVQDKPSSIEQQQQQHLLTDSPADTGAGSSSPDQSQGQGKGQDWLEPVINLHYSTEGTTSSTIQVEFTSFPPEGAVSSTGTSSTHTSAVPISSERAQSGQTSVPDRPSAGGSSDSDKDRGNNSDNVPESDRISEDKQGPVEPWHNAESVASVEEASAAPPSMLHSVQVIKAGDQSPGQSTTPEPDTSHGHSGEGATGGIQLTDSDSQGGDNSDRQEDKAEAGQAPDKQSTASSSTAAPSTRQRRIGRSGPPTGDFQLYSPEGDSSDDGPGEEPAPRRRPHWDDSDDLERNVAAIRLQSFYRKKHAEREERELESSKVYQPKVKRKFRGHRNARTMIKEANFWGDSFVMSGSDCGHIFIWDRLTTKLVMLLEADKHVVNCLQPHPFDPVLASSGIDYDVKVWAPLSSTQYFDERSATEIMRRNEVMLEETRDTITVPAAFMLRVLASLNHIRTGRPSENDSASDSD